MTREIIYPRRIEEAKALVTAHNALLKHMIGQTYVLVRAEHSTSARDGGPVSDKPTRLCFSPRAKADAVSIYVTVTVIGGDGKIDDSGNGWDIWIEDIDGDLADLTGSPITVAECVSGEWNDEEHEAWVFYKFATQRGSVTVRWCGTDNGYYGVFPEVQVEMRA